MEIKDLLSRRETEITIFFSNLGEKYLCTKNKETSNGEIKANGQVWRHARVVMVNYKILDMQN